MYVIIRYNQKQGGFEKMTVETIISKLEAALKFSDEALEAYGENCTNEEREWIEIAQERFVGVINCCMEHSNDFSTCYALYKWICSLYGKTEA